MIVSAANFAITLTMANVRLFLHMSVNNNYSYTTIQPSTVYRESLTSLKFDEFLLKTF